MLTSLLTEREENPPLRRFLPLFLVSLVAIGVEIALTRFFALASWSEYGYWVISIAMVGLTASGVVASLATGWIGRNSRWLLPVLPLVLILTAAGGWFTITIVPFNPLELQNRFLWQGQALNILKYYAALFPFFFLTGLYITLFFIVHSERIAKVYGFDLAGAGLGGILVLVLMFFVHPFDLVAALVPLLGLATLLSVSRRRITLGIATICVLAVAEAVILASPAHINEYKDIYGPSNAQGSRVLNEVRSPKGVYHLLDAFTERVDTDLSNNPVDGAVHELPRAYGLYQDGNRIGALPEAAGASAPYAVASLDSLPYVLRPGTDVMLLGAGGGFRIAEALALGATSIVAIEPDRILLRALQDGLPPSPPMRSDPRVRLIGGDALGSAAATGQVFRLIDISRDFAAQSDINRLALTSDGLHRLLGRLTPDGILSIPVSVREFTNYAAKIIATAAAVVRRDGGADAPLTRVLIYRSAWNMRVLIAAAPWSPADIERVLALCRDRSFDLVYYPGMDPAAAEPFNELPIVTFSDSAPAPVRDAMSQEAAALLSGRASPFHDFFDLRPSTFDRPAFFTTLPVSELGTILSHIERVPREELPFLINIAVLAQAIVIALLVLLLPLLRRAAARPPLRNVAAAVVYFSGLGLGFLWLEIYLIERVAYLTHDRAAAFALVLATMLIGSGCGSLLVSRYAARPRRTLSVAVAGTLGWCLLAGLFLEPLFLASAGMSLIPQSLLVVVLVAPLAVLLGFPMAIGLAQFSPNHVSFLPWAWSVNGAWSIIATPLANLLALTIGLKLLVVGAAFAYLLVWLSLSGFQEHRRAA